MGFLELKIQASVFALVSLSFISPFALFICPNFGETLGMILLSAFLFASFLYLSVLLRVWLWLIFVMVSLPLILDKAGRAYIK